MAEQTLIEPQPKQRMVLSCPYQEILYGGAAGSGKSYLLILDWLAHWTTYGPKANGVLFRNSFPELLEIQREMAVVFEPTNAKFKEKDMLWQFPDGAQLRLSYLDRFEDALKHKGAAFTFRAHDELTQRPTDEEYVYLMSRMRSAHGIPIRVISATNPDGPGHLWVKKRWQIDRFPHGMHPIHTYTDIENGLLLGENEVYDKLPLDKLPPNIRRHTRVFIPGTLADNSFLHTDGHYRAGLLALPENQRKMLLEGSWDVIEGAFFTEWDARHHVVQAFTPPKEWKRWMGADWGSSAPYVIGWFAQSPNGDVYMYRELAGYLPGKLNEGTRETPATVAAKIRALEQEADEWITERYLDSSCFDSAEQGVSVAEQFRKARVVFQPSQRKFKAGSIMILRDYLKVTNGSSRLKIMNNCVYTIQTLPLLRVDKGNVEQYDTHGPDHACLHPKTRMLTPDGWQAVEALQEGAMLWTPVGWRRGVSAPTGVKPVLKVRLTNGAEFKATEDHEFLTTRGFVPLMRLLMSDTLIYGGRPNGSNRVVREGPGVPGEPVLPLRVLLPEEWKTAAPGHLGTPPWGYSQGVPCTPCEREPGGQPTSKSGIDRIFRSLAPAHDDRGTQGTVEGERKEGYCGSSGVAPVPRGEGVASEGCGCTSVGGSGYQSSPSSASGSVLPMLRYAHDREGELLLLPGLPNERVEPRFFGVQIAGIEPAGVVPVFDFGVEDAHCAMVEGGIFASNCDMLCYALRKNIKTKEELASDHGVSARNMKALRRMGAYGAR